MIRKHFYERNNRVVVRTGSSILNFLLGDHSLVPRDRLGSTAITTSSSGGKLVETRYYPWGTERYSFGLGATPTTYRFTGQRLESNLGLYFYGARWYDPYLNRWIQPDSIIPDPNNSQSYDHYAYALNNPVRYTDPSGNFSEDEIKEIFGFDKNDPWEKILELFEKGGKYEGRWGWLDILTTAEIGDQITIDWGENLLPNDHPALNGKLQFDYDAQGNLILKGNDFYFDSDIAGLLGEKYTLNHFVDNNGKKVAAAFLVIVTDVTVGLPGIAAMASGNPALYKAGEFLETTVVLPVNLLAYKMWKDAEKEKFVVLIVQAIPGQDQDN